MQLENPSVTASLMLIVPVDVEDVPRRPHRIVLDGVASGAAHDGVLVRVGEGRAALDESGPRLGVEGLVARDALARLVVGRHGAVEEAARVRLRARRGEAEIVRINASKSRKESLIYITRV